MQNELLKKENDDQESTKWEGEREYINVVKFKVDQLQLRI